MKELTQLENQAERGLVNIRARKTEILMDQINQLKRKSQLLGEENVVLRKKCNGPYMDGGLLSILHAGASGAGPNNISNGSCGLTNHDDNNNRNNNAKVNVEDVETQLNIGPPDVHCNINQC